MKKAGKDTLEKPEVVFKMPQTMNVDEGKDTAPALSVRGGNYKEGNSRIIPKNCEIIGERSLIEKRGVRSDNEKLPVEGDSVVQMKFSKRNNKRFPKENEKSKDSGRTVVLVDQADSSKQKSSSFKSKKGPVLGAEHRIFKEAVKRSGTSNEKKITGRHKQIDVDDLKSVRINPKLDDEESCDVIHICYS